MDHFADDWRTAPLTPAQLALLEYCEKLTLTPAKCSRDDIDNLSWHGFSDRAIVDAVGVCSYFNHINRIADGLGADPEDWLDDAGREVGEPPPGTPGNPLA